MKRVLSLIMILMVLLLAYGCGGTNQTPDVTDQTTSPIPETASHTPEVTSAAPEVKDSGYSVIDSRGEEVHFDTIPQTIVSLTPSDTEILYALGAGDKIIAVSDYCNYPEDTKNKQKLPTGELLNMEELMALKADVVFLGKMASMADQIKQLEAAGTRVIITEINSLEDLYGVIAMCGAVLGLEREAQSLVESMKKDFEAIKAKAALIDPVRAYVEVSPLEYGLWSCGRNTFAQELLDITGAENIFSELEGWSAVSEEQVLSLNPEIIFTTASPTTGIADPVGDITKRANWSTIDAVKNNRVYMLDSDMLTVPGPRLVEAAKQIQDALMQ
jgi:iron complex transport system substrate-binding protein